MKKLLATALVIVAVALAIGRTLGEQPTALVRPTPALTSSPVASPSIASPVSGVVTYDNPVLGYRISLPEGYRRAQSRVFTGQEALGNDFYTRTTEREAQEACAHDIGDLPPFGPGDPTITVQVSRDVAGISLVDWVTTPRVPGAQPLSTHRKVEPVTLAGHEAVRLTWEQTGESAVFVVRANDRIYSFSPDGDSLPSRMPKGWFDAIAHTFTVLQPSAFPAPTATIPPRQAAHAVADGLATAFAARDADAVARLMRTCWIGVSPLIDGKPPGGVLNRSVVLFTQGLRERFAAGDLSVTIDPTVQVETQARGPDRYFVRSDWREPDRTTRIDLFLNEADGVWLWGEAVHHYTRADLINGSCFPYRSPWVASAKGSC